MQRAARAGSLEGEKRNREPRAPQRTYPAPTYRPGPPTPLPARPTLHLPCTPRSCTIRSTKSPSWALPNRPTLHLSPPTETSAGFLRLGDETQDLPASRLPPADLPCTGSRAERRGGLPDHTRLPTPPSRTHTHAHNTRTHAHTPSPPRKARRQHRRRALAGKSRRRRAYPQQIVTTRLLYCLQDPFAQLSRLQRI